MANTYFKYAPNVFIAKCDKPYVKGKVIKIETKYGNTHECKVVNFLGARVKEGVFFYSILRIDGFNSQERAKRKAAKYEDWARKSEKKMMDYYYASKEGADFLRLAEPIKIGHHSEKKHRALIDRNWKRMGKSVEFRDKAKEHEYKADYWKSKENDINLFLPESLAYYKFKLEESMKIHAEYKSGVRCREHSFSLTYAKKDVNKFQDLFNKANFLWGKIVRVQNYWNLLKK